MADPLSGGGEEEEQKWNYDSRYVDGGYWTSNLHPGLRWSSTLQNWVTQAAPGDLAPEAPKSSGGSSSPTNVYITQNPGQLYQDVVSDGNDGYPAGTVYQVNQLTGAHTVKYRPSTSEPASLWNDRNSDGYDDQSGLPNGVTSIGGKLYFQGKRVNPDGSLYTGADEPAAKASTWTGYGPKGQGTYYLDGPGGTPGTYIGRTTAPSTSSGSSSGNTGAKSGAVGGGGDSAAIAAAARAASDAAAARENAADRAWRSGESALDRAQRASEFAASHEIARNRALQDAAKTYGDALYQYDPGGFQIWQDAMGGGRLDNALLTGTHAVTANAVTPGALALGALRGLQGGLSAPGTGGAAGGTAGGGTGTGTGTGTTTPPATEPVDWRQASNDAVSAAMDGQPVDPFPHLPGFDATRVWDQRGIDYTQSQNPGSANYVEERPQYDPATGKQFWPSAGVTSSVPLNPQEADDRQRDMGPVSEPVRSVPQYSNPGATNIAAPKVDANGNWIVPGGTLDTQGKFIPAMARGGLTRAPLAIVGDPQADGRPNPEIIHNPTGAPISVIPMKGQMPPMRGGLSHMMPDGSRMAGPPMGMGRRPMARMGGLQRIPRFAYGTTDNYGWGFDVDSTPYQDTRATTYSRDAAPAPAPAPAYTAPAPQPAPAPAPAPTTATTTTQPAATTTAPQQPAPAPSSQIGNYSTAPSTAGQPVPPPTPAPAPTGGLVTPTAANPTGAIADPALFNEVEYARLNATNPWMSDPTSFMNVDYETRDPVARQNFERWLTLAKGIPQASIDFARARNRLGGLSAASIGLGR